MSAGSKVQKNGVPERVTATIKIGQKTTTGRGGRYMTEQALGIAVSTRNDYPRGPPARQAGGRRRGDAVRRERYEADAALTRPGGRRKAEHPRPQRRGPPRLPDPRGRGLEQPRRTLNALDEESRGGSGLRVDGLDRRPGSNPQAPRINFCVDLSATPYYLARAGEDTNRIFPWVVSDFGLTDAIESGLVKIPQLAHSDPTGEEQAAYFNIWRWIMGKLTAGERGGQARESEGRGGAAVRRASDPAARAGVGGGAQGLGGGRRADRPPVFILVCKNTKLASVIYEWLAEGKAPAGIPRPTSPELRNTDGTRLTIRVDSKVVRRDRYRGRQER